MEQDRQNTIEVVCEDMMCFRVNAKTLEPLTVSYYQPAAWADPRGPQMSYGDWCVKRHAQRGANHG